MMESTPNGNENLAHLEDESPFEDGEKVMEGVDIAIDEDAAAEEARKEEIRQQMIKVCAVQLSFGLFDFVFYIHESFYARESFYTKKAIS